MGKKIIKQLVPALDKMKWPDLRAASEKGRRIYAQSVDRIDESQGDTKALSSTLRLLQTADSQPYAFAGVAYVLLAAAREAGDSASYYSPGLDAAMAWLEKAQESEPELVDINVIEALVYTFNGRLDDARLVLDYLQRQEPSNYMLHLAEIAYWVQTKELDEAVHWFGQAEQSALTVPQKLRLQAKMGDMFFEAQQNEKAIEVYKKAVHFDNKNAALLHKLSICYWRLENLEDADIYNRRALRISDFAAARKMEEALKKKRGDNTGMLGRFFKR